MLVYSPGGAAIAGAILTGDDKLADAAMGWISLHGLHVSPHNAQLIAKQVAFVGARIQRSNELTLQVLAELQKLQPSTPVLKGICHVSLEAHRSHAVAKKQLAAGLWPSVFTIALSASKNAVIKVLPALKQIEHKTSFGSARSRTDPWPSRDEKGNTVVRIAIGYNDSLDVVMKGLKQLFTSLSKK